MSNPDGGPAFPQTIDDMGTLRSVTQGMSLRDYFAAAAMTGLLNHWGDLSPPTRKQLERLSGESYQVADAMLKERSK